MGNYVTRDELRNWLSIRQQHVEPNDELDNVLAAAESIIDDYCGRTFVEDGSPTIRIYRAASPLVIEDISDTGSAVVETSSDRETWSTYTGTNWFTSPDLAWPATRWEASDGSPGGWMRFTATHGWSAVPDPVKQATKLVAAQLNARRNSPNGIEAFSEAGGAVRASRYIDGHAELALRPYRRVDAFVGIA